MKSRNLALSMLAVVPFAGVVAQSTQGRAYLEAIQRTANMVADRDAVALVQRHGLNLVNLTWEDTGRYKGSSVGPNISDMTIQVSVPAGRGEVQSHLMPVVRFPNFSDKTADLRASDFTLLVGNEKGRPLQRVSLEEYLRNPTQFMSFPRSWNARNPTLWADRDENVLVSAQACFLPVPQQGKATFNPVLFNYQSTQDNPAVLAILATREGTSMTVIDNRRLPGEPWNWGQTLFHNVGGKRASLTGERFSDFRASGKSDPNVRDSALNMVLLIQVPLKNRNVSRSFDAAPGAASEAKATMRGSDVENAVIGHGKLEGPFTEVNGLAIERDPRFPVRVTVQYYKATSNGIVSQADIASIRRDIDRVYEDAEFVGSLVTQGETGRPTEYWGNKVQPAGWWIDFWRRYEADTGVSRFEATQRLQGLLGRDFERRPVSDLYLRHSLRDLKATSPTKALPPGRRGF